MPINRNALIRYRTIDGCLRNRRRRWTLEDLIDACSDALYEYEGIDKGVSRRTVQADLEVMRSGKLGYEAPIVVIEKRYYTYAEADFSISNIPLDAQDLNVLAEASALLQQFKGLPHSADLTEMVLKLEDKIYAGRSQARPVVEFERNDLLKGLQWIDVLRRAAVDQRSVSVTYRSFRARYASTFLFSTYLLKEYRNRWFAIGVDHRRRTQLVILAIDRIEDIADVSDIDDDYTPNTLADLATYFEHVIGVTRDQKSTPRKIVFRVSTSDAPYIATKPLHPSQHLERTEPNGHVFSINVIPNFELERELLGFGAALEVLHPPGLRARIATIHRQAGQLYDAPSSSTTT
ncbi:MAG: WYL domain-containing protein [Bacteroidetes bacterium]|nr:WYL domain-containing protein [Bacteroidota bacterium]